MAAQAKEARAGWTQLPPPYRRDHKRLVHPVWIKGFVGNIFKIASSAGRAVSNIFTSIFGSW